MRQPVRLLGARGTLVGVVLAPPLLLLLLLLLAAQGAAATAGVVLRAQACEVVVAGSGAVKKVVLRDLPEVPGLGFESAPSRQARELEQPEALYGLGRGPKPNAALLAWDAEANTGGDVIAGNRVARSFAFRVRAIQAGAAAGTVSILAKQSPSQRAVNPSFITLGAPPGGGGGGGGGGGSTPPAGPTPKILALHGGGGSVAGFQQQQGVQDLVAALGGTAEVVFVSSPEPNGVWIRDPPGGKDEPTTDPAWADDTFAFLDQVVADQGPFAGIMGYSQGAAIIPAYLEWITASQANYSFDFVAMFNGYLETLHQGVMDRINGAAPFPTPALVFIGDNDFAFAPLGPALAAVFADPVVVRSSVAGHELPTASDPAFREVLAFFEAQLASASPPPQSARAAQRYRLQQCTLFVDALLDALDNLPD